MFFCYYAEFSCSKRVLYLKGYCEKLYTSANDS